jgi:transposase
MDAYSGDLRKKIVEAVERHAMKKSEVACLFRVSLSSVRRYVRKFRQGISLSPGKAAGKRPKVDERAKRLLEADPPRGRFHRLFFMPSHLTSFRELLALEAGFPRRPLLGD